MALLESRPLIYYNEDQFKSVPLMPTKIEEGRTEKKNPHTTSVVFLITFLQNDFFWLSFCRVVEEH